LLLISIEIIETRASDAGVDHLIFRETFSHVVPESKGGTSGENNPCFFVRQLLGCLYNPTYVAIVVLAALPISDRSDAD
jgi:hypothetical protein